MPVMSHMLTVPAATGLISDGLGPGEGITTTAGDQITFTSGDDLITTGGIGPESILAASPVVLSRWNRLPKWVRFVIEAGIIILILLSMMAFIMAFTASAQGSLLTLSALGTAPASGDIFHVIDISDPAFDPGGTDKKMTAAVLLSVLDAANVTVGVLADARVQASNITQHVAAINHNSLLNYVADEHVLHAGVVITCGIGLTGCGDISSSFALDVVSTEAGFFTDGGVTSLTCGGSNEGKGQVLDDGRFEFCDGAATSILRTLVPSALMSGGATQTTGGAVTLDTESVEDLAGAMATGNTETCIVVTYQDGDGTMDYVVTDSCIDHDVLTNFVAAEHLDWALSSQGTIHATNYVDNNTQLSNEQVEDFVGAMLTGNTETCIVVTYQDGDGTIDFVVTDSCIDHDALTNFLTAEHVDWAGASAGTVHATNVGANHIDAIGEVASALRSGNDLILMTGTAGAAGNCAEFNGDGDLIDSGAGCGGGSGDNVSVNGLALVDANFTDSTEIAFVINRTASPDEISPHIVAASITGAKLVADPTLSGANFTGIPSSAILTEVRTIPFDAGGMPTDNTECTNATESIVNSGPKIFSVACPMGTSETNGILYFDRRLPPDYNGGTFITLLEARMTTDAGSGTLHTEVFMMCRTDDETINSTWGTSIDIDLVTVAGDAVNEILTAESLAVTGNGCAAGAEHLFGKIEICDTDATPDGNCTSSAGLEDDFSFMSVLVKYTSNVGS